MKEITAELRTYIESAILPRYESFDAAHRRDHVDTVIRQSLMLAESFPEVNVDMTYTIAAYHDTGLVENRETHHVVSARIIRADKELRRWFTAEQIDVMADAAEDHRASAKSVPRTIYGRIVAEADRQIIPEVVIRRTIQYGLSHYPDLDKEGHYARTVEHLHEKYAEGGYLRLWLDNSPSAKPLAELRDIIRDEVRLRATFERIWQNL